MPLSEITITWPRRNDFEGDEQRPPVVLTGKHLGQHLEWMARTMPANLDLQATDDVFLPELAYLRHEGVAQILRVLGRADVDLPPVLALLAGATEHIAAELAANDHTRKIEDATVRIGAPAEAK